MKKNLRRIERMLTIFGDVFYCCTVYTSEISLQAKFHSNIVKKAMSLKFRNQIDGNGYVELTRGKYKITLTE